LFLFAGLELLVVAMSVVYTFAQFFILEIVKAKKYSASKLNHDYISKIIGLPVALAATGSHPLDLQILSPTIRLK
jgi:hypothetical protein